MSAGQIFGCGTQESDLCNGKTCHIHQSEKLSMSVKKMNTQKNQSRMEVAA